MFPAILIMALKSKNSQPNSSYVKSWAVEAITNLISQVLSHFVNDGAAPR